MQDKRTENVISFFWAKNGVRTRDLNLGKVALYQLSYFRIFVKERVQFLILIADANLIHFHKYQNVLEKKWQNNSQ